MSQDAPTPLLSVPGTHPILVTGGAGFIGCNLADRLASLGHVILVGRGANIITARMPQVFHVRLVAPWAARVEHLAEQNRVSQAEAARIAKSRYQARRAYVRRYFNAEIDEPTLYDLTLNTSRFGFALSADVIVQAALAHHRKFKQTEEAVDQSAPPDTVVL